MFLRKIQKGNRLIFLYFQLNFGWLSMIKTFIEFFRLQSQVAAKDLLKRNQKSFLFSLSILKSMLYFDLSSKRRFGGIFGPWKSSNERIGFIKL